jgi:hypothetical protein
MNWKRVKAVGKLVLLFGTPLLVVLGLFGYGVYVGDLYRHGITSFEKEWLGLDVEVAPAHEEDGSDTAGESKPDKKADEKPDKKADEKPDDDEKADDAETPPDAKPESKPEPKPEPAKPEPAKPEPPEPAKPEPVPAPTEVVPEPKVDPLEGVLSSRLGVPVTIGVKVLVDDALVEQHPDWIDYVQRTLSAASSIYEKQFGVTLELTSVGRWGVPTAGLSSGELLEDVESRPREKAQLVLGFTGRPLDDRTSGKAYTPAEDGPYNGSAAVVYARAGRHSAHVRGLLHELGHLFGALDVTDRSAPAYRSGSWMSYAPVAPGQAPWIDPANRARILERKDKPFAPQGAMAPASEAPGATPATNPTEEAPQ